MLESLYNGYQILYIPSSPHPRLLSSDAPRLTLSFLASLLWREHARHTTDFGPVYSMLPLPGTCFPWIYTWLTPSPYVFVKNATKSVSPSLSTLLTSKVVIFSCPHSLPTHISDPSGPGSLFVVLACMIFEQTI